jgi:hypothetical protein
MTKKSEFAHLTGRQFADQIFDSLNQDVGVDIRPILLDTTRSQTQRHRTAATLLLEALFERAENSPHREQWATPEGSEDRQLLRLLSSGDVDIEPNMLIKASNVEHLKKKSGNDIKDYLYSLTKRFENMAKETDAGMLAVQIIGGGLFSVGVSMAIQTYKAWKTAESLLSALQIGIKNIGMKTAIAAIVIALVSLLTWLIVENPKKFLGMVINDTDTNLVVNDWRKGVDGGKGGDLYLRHGAMRSFPQDYEEGEYDQLLQINKRIYFGKANPKNAAYAGIFFAEKNNGLYGTEGIAIYSAKDGARMFAHAFACPYGEDNGTKVLVLNGDAGVTAPALFSQMYLKRGVRSEDSLGAYSALSAVNASDGGVVGCITCFSQA